MADDADRPEHGRPSYERRRDDNNPAYERQREAGIILALTPDEFAQLRKMIAAWERVEKMTVAHERAEWAWSALGVWMKWLAAIGAALVAAKLLLSDFKDILRVWLAIK